MKLLAFLITSLGVLISINDAHAQLSNHEVNTLRIKYYQAKDAYAQEDFGTCITLLDEIDSLSKKTQSPSLLSLRVKADFYLRNFYKVQKNYDSLIKMKLSDEILKDIYPIIKKFNVEKEIFEKYKQYCHSFDEKRNRFPLLAHNGKFRIVDSDFRPIGDGTYHSLFQLKSNSYVGMRDAYNQRNKGIRPVEIIDSNGQTRQLPDMFEVVSIAWDSIIIGRNYDYKSGAYLTTGELLYPFGEHEIVFYEKLSLLAINPVGKKDKLVGYNQLGEKFINVPKLLGEWKKELYKNDRMSEKFLEKYPHTPGYVRFSQGVIAVRPNANPGFVEYVDSNGKVILKGNFRYGEMFSDSLARVTENGDGRDWYYAHLSGNKFKNIYPDKMDIDMYYDFSNGYARVARKSGKLDDSGEDIYLWDFLNSKGELIFDFGLCEMKNDLKTKFSIIQFLNDPNYYIIDNELNVVFNCGERRGYRFCNQLNEMFQQDF